MHENRTRIDALARDRHLPKDDYLALLTTADAEDDAYLAERARAVKERIYGKKIFIRGLIEVSNTLKLSRILITERFPS